jgi:hypothetical protein
VRSSCRIFQKTYYRKFYFWLRLISGGITLQYSRDALRLTHALIELILTGRAVCRRALAAERGNAV